MPEAEVFAADISDDALAVAAENFQKLGAAVTLRKADALGGLEEAFPEHFDMIVSNPPYVPESDRAAMHPMSATTNPAWRCSSPTTTPSVSTAPSRRRDGGC